MTRSHSISRERSLSFALVFLFAFAAAPAGAQYIYGITSLQLDSDGGRAYGYSETLLDYVACYYYDAAVVGGLYENNSLISGGAYHGVCSAKVFTNGALQDERYYTQLSDHYVIAYYYDDYYGYYDPYGFSYFSSGGYGGGFSYYGDYGPYYSWSETYYLGWTQVTLYNQGQCARTPVLNGPSSVTRGNTATFTLTNVCPTATVRDWSFSDGAETVNRGSSSATSWPGRMVASGTVRVTVVQGGRTHNLSKSITVNPRTNFAFSAVTPAPAPGNNFNCGSTTLSVPVPPVSGGRLGQTCLNVRASWETTEIGDGGPNNRFKYISAASPSSSSGPTQIYYLIHPDLENTNSDFYKAQCGNYDAATNPNGFISGSQLLANTRGHEYGPTRGHYQQYVTAQNKPENNIGTGLERLVRGPSTSLDAFGQAATAEFTQRSNVISTEFNFEGCNNDVRYDVQCVFKGNINFPPYQPCSPRRPGGISGSAASSNQVNLSWTDDSSDEQGFRIERSQAGGAFVQIASLGAGATSYSDTSVSPGTTYTYRVIAWNSIGSSAPAETTVTTPSTGSGCGEPSCVNPDGQYISHFTGPNCDGTESYYLPYDGYGYQCRPYPSSGARCGTIRRTVTNRSYRYAGQCYPNAWPNGNTLSDFVTVYR